MKAMLGGSLTLQNELYALISKLSNGEGDVEEKDECVAEGEGVGVISESNVKGNDEVSIDVNVVGASTDETVTDVTASMSGGSTPKTTVISLDDVMRSAVAASMSSVSNDMSGGVNVAGLVENVLAGGDNVSSMVGNVLAGGDIGGSSSPSNTNVSVEQVVDNIFTGGNVNANSTEYTGAEIISQILSDNDSDSDSDSGDSSLPQSSPSPSAIAANAAHIDTSSVVVDSDSDSDSGSEDLVDLAHDISLAIADEKNDEMLNDADINIASDDERSESEQLSDEEDDANKYVKILTEIESKEPVSALAGGGVMRSPQRVTVINMYPWIMRTFD